MWAMWANILKNFVRGPSAVVTFGARPYPGALKQTAIGTRPAAYKPYNTYKPYNAYKPYRTLQCSTLVGGNVGSVHMTRSLAGHDHVAMWP